jgi:DNA-directed RNA polymerase specialized sigma24 family protein
MAASSIREFAEHAVRDQVPWRAVLQKCRHWSVRPDRAAQIADEAAAEAFCRSLRFQFESEARYRCWITRTALNFAVDLLRAEARTRSLPPLDFAVLAATPNVNVDVSRELASAIAQLTDEEKGIIQWSLDGLTLDEMAEKMYPNDTASPNAKRLRIKRTRDIALRHLRDYFAHYDLGRDCPALNADPPAWAQSNSFDPIDA